MMGDTQKENGLSHMKEIITFVTQLLSYMESLTKETKKKKKSCLSYKKE